MKELLKEATTRLGQDRYISTDGVVHRSSDWIDRPSCVVDLKFDKLLSSNLNRNIKTQENIDHVMTGLQAHKKNAVVTCLRCLYARWWISP